MAMPGHIPSTAWTPLGLDPELPPAVAGFLADGQVDFAFQLFETLASRRGFAGLVGLILRNPQVMVLRAGAVSDIPPTATGLRPCQYVAWKAEQQLGRMGASSYKVW